MPEAPQTSWSGSGPTFTPGANRRLSATEIAVVVLGILVFDGVVAGIAVLIAPAMNEVCTTYTNAALGVCKYDHARVVHDTWIRFAIITPLLLIPLLVARYKKQGLLVVAIVQALVFVTFAVHTFSVVN